MTVHVGIDLAWGDRARTGLAVADAAGALVASGSAASDGDIDDWLADHAAGEVGVVAVDAPLVVTNPSGRRDRERVVTAAFGRHQAGCHPSNTGMGHMNRPGRSGSPAATGGAPTGAASTRRRGSASRSTRTPRRSGCSGWGGR